MEQYQDQKLIEKLKDQGFSVDKKEGSFYQDTTQGMPKNIKTAKNLCIASAILLFVFFVVSPIFFYIIYIIDPANQPAPNFQKFFLCRK